MSEELVCACKEKVFEETNNKDLLKCKKCGKLVSKRLKAVVEQKLG